MTKLEVIKTNKRLYAELLKAIETMSGLEKVVAETFTTEWLSSNKWMGGLGDSKANKLYENKIAPMGYTFDEAYEEFERQVNLFV